MGKSSKDKRDAYYRLAKEQGWRARSAFKLLQLDEEFDLFTDVTRVVDLCAAPGSWSQVLSRVLIKGETFGRAAWRDQQAAERMRVLGIGVAGEESAGAAAVAAAAASKPRKDVKIVAIDLQPMAPLEGITMLQADITHPSTIPLLLHALDPETHDAATSESAATAAHPIDLVISDGAPDVTGLHDLDIYIQSQLLVAALGLAQRVLKPGGAFVAKIFRAGDVDALYAQFRAAFDDVKIAKPRSSRASSIEAFVVCRGFRSAADDSRVVLDGRLGAGVKGPGETRGEGEWPCRVVRDDGVTELDFGSESEDEGGGKRWIAPFLACGDLASYDADATHRLPEGYVSLDPVQPPTAPPYRRALEMRKMAGGAYGKTKGRDKKTETDT